MPDAVTHRAFVLYAFPREGGKVAEAPTEAG